jgi:inosine-uridine nucleoside N-ribohydrolase
VDDQFAIGYAMLSDNIDVLAMTAAPFVSSTFTDPADGMEASFKELVKVRDMVDPDGKMNIPCYRGSRSFMENTITPVRSEAADNIIRIVHETDDIVYIAAIGAFTNVASALMIDPSIMEKVVVIMVGANSYNYKNGNCNEYNLKQDRSAAKILFECGVPLVVLPAYGGTSQLYTTNAELNYYLKDKAGIYGNYLCDIVARDEGEALQGSVCNSRERIIWDIAAIAFLKDVEKFSWIDIHPARTITDDGYWRFLDSNALGREMIYTEVFDRCEIMSDFYTTILNGNLK